MTTTPELPRLLGTTSMTWEPTVADCISWEAPGAEAYAWVVTVDKITGDENEDESRVGFVLPRMADARLAEQVQKAGDHRVRFELFDDDGELYYAGFLTYDPDRCDEEEAIMSPLSWGMDDAGAARIVFRDRPELNCS